ncbi:MAG: hypothetical protein KDE35_02735 [Geminicoccaceae bacterium]|nr:hypothetical protein [Geminicoccaceae bacterium]
MSEAATTTDHETIRNWVEARGGRPARVGATADGEPGSGRGGVLRIAFEDEDDLEQLSWDDFFAIFEKNDLAFLHQDQTSNGSTSRFFKFVAR